MKLKKRMENFYAREVELRAIPVELPEIAGSIIYMEKIHRQSTVTLNIIFNTAAAAIVCFVLLTRGTYTNPLVEVLGTVNERYTVEAQFCRGLEMLPGYLKQK